MKENRALVLQKQCTRTGTYIKPIDNKYNQGCPLVDQYLRMIMHQLEDAVIRFNYENYAAIIDAFYIIIDDLDEKYIKYALKKLVTKMGDAIIFEQSKMRKVEKELKIIKGEWGGIKVKCKD